MVDNVQLDSTDLNKMSEWMKVIDNMGGINVRTVTFDVYGEHRVRASRRGRWGKLAVRKITKL